MIDTEYQAEQQDQNTDNLRSGNAKPDSPVGISPEELQNKPSYRIDGQVQEKKIVLHPSLLQHPKQEKEQKEEEPLLSPDNSGMMFETVVHKGITED